jgi:hypothetical protein
VPNQPSAPLPEVTTIPTLTTSEVGNQVQQLLEGGRAQVVNASSQEAQCAQQFAIRQPNRSLRLVQAAIVEGRRSTVIAMQSRSSTDVRVYVVTGCNTRGAVGTDASVSYVTTVTLRSR